MKAVIFEGDAMRDTADASEVRSAHAAGKVVWVDLDTKTDEIENLMLETFKIHPLTVEDVWNTNELPKVEDFGNYLNIIAHTVTADSDPAVLHVVELDILLGKNFVLTHNPGSKTVKAVRQSLERCTKQITRGPAWIAHALLDRTVDDLLPLIDAFDEEVARIEVTVMDKAGTPKGPPVLRRIFKLKRALQTIRRTNIHQRELLLRLSRGEFDEISQDLLPFFRDVYDQFARVTDLVESYRELLTNALEAYLSVQSNRMNEVMKTLTLMSTVMLPLTFIAGVYGMNFDNMPELHWKYGYLFAVLLMVAVAAGILQWFRHKKWL